MVPHETGEAVNIEHPPVVRDAHQCTHPTIAAVAMLMESLQNVPLPSLITWHPVQSAGDIVGGTVVPMEWRYTVD